MRNCLFDKVIFILSGLSALCVFILDWLTNIINLDLKWQILLGLITLLSGFFTIISFYFDNKYKKFGMRITDVETKMSTLYNKIIKSIRSDFNSNFSQMHNLFKYMDHSNEDFKEYAHKEVATCIGKLNSAINIGESEILNEVDYYKKLDQLADRIKEDKYNLEKSTNENRHPPFIWALTCFNDDEWSVEREKEDAWSDRLEILTSNDGIDVERICILSEQIQDFIKLNDSNRIKAMVKDNKHIASFMGFLSRYYQKNIIDKYRKTTKHYAFFPNISGELNKTNGFFGICLSNGEKHIVKGDCSINGNSTAKIVFNCDELYAEFKAKKNHRSLLEAFINEKASDEFKKYLKSKNIILSKQ